MSLSLLLKSHNGNRTPLFNKPIPISLHIELSLATAPVMSVFCVSGLANNAGDSIANSKVVATLRTIAMIAFQLLCRGFLFWSPFTLDLAVA
jgi:hypothetical protein